jgi:hypothetical protein
MIIFDGSAFFLIEIRLSPCARCDGWRKAVAAPGAFMRYFDPDSFKEVTLRHSVIFAPGLARNVRLSLETGMATAEGSVAGHGCRSARSGASLRSRSSDSGYGAITEPAGGSWDCSDRGSSTGTVQLTCDRHCLCRSTGRTGVPQALSALIPDDGGPIRFSVTGPRSISR